MYAKKNKTCSKTFMVINFSATDFLFAGTSREANRLPISRAGNLVEGAANTMKLANKPDEFQSNIRYFDDTGQGSYPHKTSP